MTTHANTGAAPDAAFNPFTAGIEFMQQFTKNMAANSGLGEGAAAGGMGLGSMPNIPGMPSWAMPSMDPAELDKRINELKTVLFWLEQNANALKTTVQALEVQKMTLEALKSMSDSMAAATSATATASEATANMSAPAKPQARSRKK